MTNPFDAFLEEYGQEKSAGPAGNFRDDFGKALVGGLGAAGATAAIGGAGYAASRIFDAATKSRDFRHMLEHNEDVKAHHDADPRKVNQMYSTLRTMNPTYAKDPIVAGSFMRRMLEFPMTAGGIAAESVGTRGSFPSLLDKATEEGMGVGKGYFARQNARRPEAG